MNIVLVAGGGGTRLWPLSRAKNPKQFLDLGTGKSLLQHTYDRAKQLSGPDNIYVATTEIFKNRVKEHLPEIKPDRIFIESAKRDTGPAVAAVCLQLKNLGHQDEPVAFMWADHVFTAENKFIEVMRKVPQLVEENPNDIIIVGHHPTYPETSLGYIEAGESVGSDPDVRRVKSFKEKPDLETAQKYVAGGKYYWNMAYISCTPRYLLAQLAELNPDLWPQFEELSEAMQDRDRKKVAELYSNLPKISIDYILLEKTPRIIVAAGDFGWTDVGNWGTVRDVFGQAGDHVPQGHHIHVDSQNNYIYNATTRVVSMIGVKDTIAVVTDDAILITDRDNCGKVKEVVAKLEEGGLDEHL